MESKLCANKECKQGNFGKRKRFEPRTTMQEVCCYECLTEFRKSKIYKQKEQARIRKENKANIKQIRESLKTQSDYLKDLQKVFNQYIRLRDADLPCISCQKPTRKGNEDAGHFYPTTKSALRFNEIGRAHV